MEPSGKIQSNQGRVRNQYTVHYTYFYFRLINALRPGSVKKINTMKAPFKQRENIELFLKGAADYGLKEQDLFQVSRVISSQHF